MIYWLIHGVVKVRQRCECTKIYVALFLNMHILHGDDFAILGRVWHTYSKSNHPVWLHLERVHTQNMSQIASHPHVINTLAAYSISMSRQKI